jgi:hypothetical protein
MPAPETPIESYGLACKTALVVAAIRLGYVSHEHKDDLTHEDVRRALARFEATTQDMERWMAAVDALAGERAGGERLRVGDPSKIRFMDDESTPNDARQ